MLSTLPVAVTAADADAHARRVEVHARTRMMVMVPAIAIARLVRVVGVVRIALDDHTARAAFTPATAKVVTDHPDVLDAAVGHWCNRAQRRRLRAGRDQCRRTSQKRDCNFVHHEFLSRVVSCEVTAPRDQTFPEFNRDSAERLAPMRAAELD